MNRTRIQGITLPPHHQDKPGDHPTCKGFALVTLQNPSDLNFLLHRWPWDRIAQTKTDSVAEFPDALEASKFGFRTLPKMRWDELREEYLAYRQQLVEEINAFEDAEALIHVPPTSSAAAARKSPAALVPSPRDVSPVDLHDAPTIDASSPYPANSLIFVRNVHPETNKTTLRKLFSAAFVVPLANGLVQGDGVDYVDYNKGMDSVSVSRSRCYFTDSLTCSVMYVSPPRNMPNFLSGTSRPILFLNPMAWTILAPPQTLEVMP
jgi:xRRM domain